MTMTLNPGTQLGPYEIISAIGAGGMGEVYRARDPRVGREVAIKVSTEKFSERFEREARAVAALNHPNICTLHDVGPDYIVMELVEGETLEDRIRQVAIPLEEALTIAKQIADALEEAHEKGIIHRDLKPANIKIRPDGTVKVLDFGLAKVSETQDLNLSNSPTLSAAATQQGIILGTAGYMSPEQARGKPVDKRADIWAFGVVLYEMLTGKRLFEGDTVSDTLAAVLTREPDWDRVPLRARLLLRGCLQRDQKRRLADISDSRLLLEEELQNASQVGSPRRRPWLAWGVAAAFFLAFALVRLVHFWEKPPVAEPISFQIPLPEKASFAPSGVFGLSPDGRRLAFYATDSNGVTRLWIRPMDSREARPLPRTESDNQSPFIWSPDSRFIAFGSDGSLKKIDISGGPPPTELCKVGGTVVGGDWNRDGVIIFGLSPSGLMRVPAEGGTPSPLVRDPSHNVHPIFLPDGRWIAYTSDESGYNEIWIRPFSRDSIRESSESGPKWMVSKSGGTRPRWKEDGKELFYLATGGKIMSLEIASRPNFLPGSITPIFQKVVRTGRPFDITSDGKRLLIADEMEESTPAPFTVILNWQAGLKK